MSHNMGVEDRGSLLESVLPPFGPRNQILKFRGKLLYPMSQLPSNFNFNFYRKKITATAYLSQVARL